MLFTISSLPICHTLFSVPENHDFRDKQHISIVARLHTLESSKQGPGKPRLWHVHLQSHIICHTARRENGTISLPATFLVKNPEKRRKKS